MLVPSLPGSGDSAGRYVAAVVVVPDSTGYVGLESPGVVVPAGVLEGEGVPEGSPLGPGDVLEGSGAVVSPLPPPGAADVVEVGSPPAVVLACVVLVVVGSTIVLVVLGSVIVAVVGLFDLVVVGADVVLLAVPVLVVVG